MAQCDAAVVGPDVPPIRASVSYRVEHALNRLADSQLTHHSRYSTHRCPHVTRKAGGRSAICPLKRRNTKGTTRNEESFIQRYVLGRPHSNGAKISPSDGVERVLLKDAVDRWTRHDLASIRLQKSDDFINTAF